MERKDIPNHTGQDQGPGADTAVKDGTDTEDTDRYDISDLPMQIMINHRGSRIFLHTRGEYRFKTSDPDLEILCIHVDSTDESPADSSPEFIVKYQGEEVYSSRRGSHYVSRNSPPRWAMELISLHDAMARHRQRLEYEERMRLEGDAALWGGDE